MQDPEDVHDRMTRNGELLGKFALTRRLTSFFFGYSHPMLAQEVLGIRFRNPIGLAAGFDKDARLTKIIGHVGMGHAEVGSITGEPCEGNPKPRLWRLKKSQGICVYYGLKNDGCEAISKRLKREDFSVPIGMSIAKTNSPATVDTAVGITDYAKAFAAMEPLADYLTVNISCPNAFGGEPFTDPKKLDSLLSEIDSIPTQKPVFLKLSPDLNTRQLDEAIEVAKRHRVHGFVCTNLLKDRQDPAIKDEDVPKTGGMSGKIQEGRANKTIAHVYRATGGQYPIVGCGGVFSAEDAYQKICLGASLIHMITGMIFEGPQVVSEINQGLVKLLKKDGFKNISEAVGADNKQA